MKCLGKIRGASSGWLSACRRPLARKPTTRPVETEDAEFGECIREHPHLPGDPGVDLVWNHMQNELVICRVNKVCRLDRPHDETVVSRSEGHRDSDRRVGSSSNTVEDDVLLEDIITREGGVARIVNMDSSEGEVVSERLSEWAEVGPVRKAPRSDRHEFSALFKEFERQPDEG